MDVVNKIQIVIITYNRAYYLKKELNQILALDSPIRNNSIIVLDNASEDDTFEVVNTFRENNPNLEYQRNCYNIGGAANICKAFEVACERLKDYVWILADDDCFDFRYWREIELAVEKNDDIICVSDYAFFGAQNKINPAFQLLQLTFLPAGIYRAKLFDSDLLQNMYNSTFTMFPHLCICAYIINSFGQIEVLDHPIVSNGTYIYKKHDSSYTRGYKDTFIIDRSKMNSWILGYSNILTLLNDKKLQKQSFDIGIQSIFKEYSKFTNWLKSFYYDKGDFNYFYEIYSLCSNKLRNIIRLSIRNEKIFDDRSIRVSEAKAYLLIRKIRHKRIALWGCFSPLVTDVVAFLSKHNVQIFLAFDKRSGIRWKNLSTLDPITLYNYDKNFDFLIIGSIFHGDLMKNYAVNHNINLNKIIYLNQLTCLL